MKYFWAIFLGCLMLASQPQAQVAAPAVTASPAAPSADDINRLANALNDPAARAALIQQLHLLADAQKQAQPDTPPVEAFGAKVMASLSAHLDDLSEEAGGLGVAFSDFPHLLRYIEHQTENPATRARWIDVGSGVLLVIGVGLLAYIVSKVVIGLFGKRLERRQPQTFRAKLCLSLARLFIDCLPIVAFLAASYSMLTSIDEVEVVGATSFAVVRATSFYLGLLALARFFISPTAPNLRLIRLSNETARYLYIWIRRLASVAIYGYFVLTAAELLGLPHGAYRALLKIVGLVFAILSCLLILQNRIPVKHWLRKEKPRKHLRLNNLQSLSSTRYWLFGIWYIFALAYVVGTYLTWTLNLQGGLTYILHATIGVVVIIALARLAIFLIDIVMDRSLGLSGRLKTAYPQFDTRANRYVPLLRALLHWAVTLLVVLGCLRVWGVNSFSWLTTKNILVSKAVAVGFVVVSAVVAWEVFAAFIERILIGAGDADHRIERSARTRTLLPLLKNVFLIFVIVIAGLIVLSEVGLDTGPLLAGAGVIGVALGFGSQSLVKDMITGIFILFENTIAVGEVVDLGNKHSGTVEALSIRSVKLRDDSGGIHTVPFSDVSSVTNLSRDFSNYLFTVRIDYRVDTDRIVNLVKEIAEGLAADSAFRNLILGPVDIWGIDGFADNGMCLKGAFKTRPLQQWRVGREFNRRLKKRMDELGIPVPMPRQEIYQAGSAVKPV